MTNNFTQTAIAHTKQKLIVALDMIDRTEANRIIEKTSDYVGYYKIGLGFLANNGIDYATSLAKEGHKIFLDLKLFDISQTITDSVARLAEKTQASILTVHGDQYVVSAAIKGRALAGCPDLNIYAVTVLTSLDLSDLICTGYQTASVIDLVTNRAKLAALAGADGVIASAHEVSAIKGLGYGLQVITPGIRSNGSLSHDQKRTMTPIEALKQGADKLVIGREITKSENPDQTTKEIFTAIMNFNYALN
jgi:orotidine-5'-phosphate decarboxylase